MWLCENYSDIMTIYENKILLPTFLNELLRSVKFPREKRQLTVLLCITCYAIKLRGNLLWTAPWTLIERHQGVSNCLFLLNLIIPFFQYTILLTSKSSSFCVTQANLLGSHTLILTGYFFFNCRILTLLYCTLSTFFLSSFPSSLFSLFSFLFSLHSLPNKL